MDRNQKNVNPLGVRFKERDVYARSRKRMVEAQLMSRGISQKNLLHAMASVPRHLFVEEAFHVQAYGDHALPIGEKQTITQPYMLALMIESLELKGGERVLDVGSGSGYSSAVLSLLAGKVFSVERLSRIAERAGKLLDRLQSSNVVIKVGDGTAGWPEEAPFDAIIVGACAPEIPPPFIEQLKPGGRLVIPVGKDPDSQQLVKVVKRGSTAAMSVITRCRFVKLVGRFGWQS
ncbi:MAG: protein-L-isoaspartate(D-aspartate) O-methyltransferase [Thermodesulfobacteriota bacterium]|nr:MAG: protein-L-isoaspartate(D-aspartate) O-methyltransferase [Thermodesulfobacteriota bacterium]